MPRYRPIGCMIFPIYDKTTIPRAFWNGNTRLVLSHYHWVLHWYIFLLRQKP